MTGSFLDTTIVVLVSNVRAPSHSAARTLVATNQPADAPYYALRELVAGPLRTLCELHNRVMGSATAGEALVGISKMNPVATRKKQVALDSFAEVFRDLCRQSPSMPLADAGKGITRELGLLTQLLWARARRKSGAQLVQPLGCFTADDFSYGSSGEIRGPGGTFNCHRKARCGAAEYVAEKEGILAGMCDALHPDKLPANLKGKTELAQRRKALTELKNKGPRAFDKGKCRSIGDAYFVAMCPPGRKLLTTNAVDFEILGVKPEIP